MTFLDFVELNRTFHELSTSSAERDDIDLHSIFYTGNGITWDKLLTQHRVVLLSESGSGKTAEIRNVAQQLRSSGKSAFFLRLEHLPTDFEGAFEEGNAKEFEQWLSSEEDGWLLLDSVDEARLRSPLDFELAIKAVRKRIIFALQRAHIVITGRTYAWRPNTDLTLCTNNLPYQHQKESAERPEAGDEDQVDAVIVRDKIDDKRSSVFTIMTMDDLNTEQIQLFARAKGIIDTKPFIDAIERADALSFTSRPQDLLEIVEFWRNHGRIGSRLELMRNSIDRRLTERDQNRAETKPLNIDNARRGSKLIAGAATMARTPIIRVPDGAETFTGLPITKILPDWTERDCSTLLSRPIFDEAIYGAVRFHHRSVREYLAAEWLLGLLKTETSRESIENIFFREQYGTEVVVPSARPLLPWMIILDERIRDRALRLAPELVFEGGDPSQLPLVVRQQLLRHICDRLAHHRSNQPSIDYTAVQRFASAELADDILDLMKKHERNGDVAWLLLRMIWQGQIKSALPAAIAVALDPRASKYPRVAAFRAIAALGAEDIQRTVRESFLKERKTLDRTWLAELINGTVPNRETVVWFLEALAKARQPEQYATDELFDAAISFIQAADFNHIHALAAGLGKLVALLPIVERQFGEIYQRYQWLSRIAALCVHRLIEKKHESALLPASLDILYRYRIAESSDTFQSRKIAFRFKELLEVWPNLNDRLFWFEVTQARKHLTKKGERLTEWWQGSFGGALWQWRNADFDRVLSFIKDQPLLDDKLVALSLAIYLHHRSGRSRQQRQALMIAARGDATIRAQLDQYLHPPAQSEQMLMQKREDRRWKRQREARARRDARNHESWRIYLKENPEKLRDPGLQKADQVSKAQYYLYQQLRRDNNHNQLGHCNWQSLAAKYGDDVALAFRDGAVEYWRNNQPTLLSEGAEPNRIPVSTIFGLMGIRIEANESPEWPKNVSYTDAELATRYATYELNGFPPWLPRLYKIYPDAINHVLLNELRWELSQVTAEQQSHYVLSDISWHGEWMWDKWGRILVNELRERDPAHPDTLAQMLKVVQGSALPDEQLRDLAIGKCKTVTATEHLSQWYAVWVGVDPGRAISSLRDMLDNTIGADARLPFAMQFLTHLLGDWRDEPSTVRTAYRAVTHLKTLYLLMHKYIRQREDIDRAGKGVYSPGLRDNAQSARERLLSLLKETPGKEAFLALTKISKTHPERGSRPWFRQHARLKAEQDAENGPWSLDQFLEFNAQLERTPTNHRELFELAWMRLLDLKRDLEEGDSSIASILSKVAIEPDMRKYIGNWLREKSRGRYSIPQEEELADATKPDMRLHGAGFDAPVPIELKLADNWKGPPLFERLENQLCRDYLRDVRSNRGIFALVYRGQKKRWALPNSSVRVNFNDLVYALEQHWSLISPHFANVDEVRVIGIDLAKRDSKLGQ